MATYMRTNTTHSLLAALAWWVAIFATILAISTITKPNPAHAQLSGSDFQAGRIIDDAVFYNDSSMSVSQIQNFLNSKVIDCDTNGEKPYAGTTRGEYGASRGYPPPYTCLKDYKQTVPTITNSGSDLCKASISGGNKSAAQIIYDVGRACSINPQVLIVMLQKEMSLVTDDWPWPSQYDKAMGYACPDSGPNYSANCDSTYFGFFNQVYNAAKAFRRYEANPTWYNYRAGRNNSILYNPNTSCGSSTVFIQNQATANLYIYTPYQPNQAALNNLYGTGDGCSAYGNRNFWRLFNDWFGSTFSNQHISLITCNNESYIIEKGVYRKRRLTAEALQAWGFSPNQSLASPTLCNYPSFLLPLERIVRSRNTGKTYLVDEGIAYNIHNQEAADAWGLGNIDAETYPQMYGSGINQYLSTEKILPSLGTSTNINRADVYLINSGNRHLITGTNTGDTTTLKLIRGYNEVPMATFSVSLLQTLPSSTAVDYSFQIGSDWYLFDHNKTRKITPEYTANWANFLSGPTLGPEALSMFKENTSISNGFRRDGYYHYLTDASGLERSESQSIANSWGINTSPTITKLLTDKLTAQQEPVTRVGLDSNIRLVSCGEDKYLIERYIAKRRPLTPEAIDTWNFSNYYFPVDAKGCSYPSYGLPLENVIRSRNTGKEYLIDNGTAYYIHDQEAADAWGLANVREQTYPQFNGESISKNLRVVRELPALADI